MKHAVIMSSDFFGPENPGQVMSAGFGIYLASLLSEDLDESQRLEYLVYYLRGESQNTNKRDMQIRNAVAQPTLTAAVAAICKLMGVKSTPRIEKNLRSSVLSLARMHDEKLKREIEDLEEKRERILRLEKRIKKLDKPVDNG
jgi:hypothetical protein